VPDEELSPELDELLELVPPSAFKRPARGSVELMLVMGVDPLQG
jgi:hypothetical protein